MLSKTIVLKAKTGLHARPASEIISFVKGYKSKVTIKNGAKVGNCASIISILALGAKCGSELELTVEGEDEAAALPAIAEFIENIVD